MRYLVMLGCAVYFLGTAAASACSIQSTAQTEDDPATTRVNEAGFTVVVSGVGTLRVAYADLVDGSAEQRAEDLRGRLQPAFDVRTPLLAVPVDDPDKLTDPDRGSLFYGSIEGTKDDGALTAATRYLVGRSCVVTVTPITRSSFAVTFSRAP